MVVRALLKLHQRLSRSGLVLALGVAFVIFEAGVFPYAYTILGSAPLDLKLFYSPAQAYATLTAYGEQGRALYRIVELTGDLLFPIIYTLLLTLSSSLLFKQAFSPDSRLQRLPLYIYPVWLFDLLENICIVTLVSRFPNQLPGLVYVTQLFTLLKFAFAGYGMLLLAWGAARVLVRRMGRSSRDSR